MKRTLYYLCGISVVVGLWARLYHLSLPAAQVFDEVYFPVFAAKMLHGVLAFDVHPPLGKMLMALGIAIFGDTHFGWRIVPALFGLGTIALMTYLWRVYFKEDKERIGAYLMTTFISLECMLALYSRVGLMDGILFFFIMGAFLLAVMVTSPLAVIGVAVTIGLAAAIKWLAVAVILPITFLMWRRKNLANFLWALPWGLLVYCLVVLLGEWIGHVPDPVKEFSVWHSQVWDYQTSLTATHPWSSVWWTWPLLGRPLLMFYEVPKEGFVQVMTAIGNPLLWWSSGLAVLGSWFYLFYLRLFKRKAVLDHPLLPLLIGHAAFFLPWAPVHRVLFIYHYLPSYGFALLVLVYWLWRGWAKQPAAILLYVVLALLLALFFFPIIMGLTISQEWLQTHIWFKSWL